jgi:prepilin signal peptidase PulO-like enzyme (type II secretory pathway)
MYFILIVLGIIFGSFINALVWRLYLKENSLNNKSELSILRGRSVCPKCKHKLSYLDLFPLFSWLLLKGRCRYCYLKISIQYPFIESVTGLIFIFSYIYWPFSFNFIGWILFIVWLMISILFISLSLYDYKYRILPNVLVYLLICLSVVFIGIYFVEFNSTLSFLLSRVLGIVFSSGIFYLIFQVSKGKWIGGGDVKLCIALGLLIGGPLEVILMIFLASFIGSFISIILLIFGRIKNNLTIAFGPLLISSAYICFFFGSDILSWYSRLFY